MSTRSLLKSVVLLAAIVVALTPTISEAKKGGKGGGGGGGGDDGGGDVQPAAYSITAFLPPNFTAIASNVQGISDVGDVVGDLDLADGQKVAIHLDMITGNYTELPRPADPLRREQFRPNRW